MDLNFKELNSMTPSLYKTWKIPKIKNGKFHSWRTIEEPCEELKIIQTRLIKNFEDFTFHDYIFGVKGKSAITNAAYHSSQKIIIKLDVRDFFPNTTMEKVTSRIYDYLKSNLSYCFIKEGTKTRLPQGAPTSSILASIGFFSTDLHLKHLAEKHGLLYTRYVDDLTFSGPYRPKGFVKEVSKIIAPDYRLNWEKVESAHSGYQKQEITGVVINNGLSTPRKLRHNVRARLDHLARNGKSLDEETRGLLSYIYSVNKDQHAALFAQYERRCDFYSSKIGKTSPCSEQGLSSNSNNNS